MNRIIFGIGIAFLSATPSFSEIISAEFEEHTNAYGHSVLGDTPEYRSLVIQVNNQTNSTKTQNAVVRSSTYKIRLPLDHVFEDLEPRLADVDGDGSNEVVVIESDFSLGASIAVYNEQGKLAETPHIGTRFRWLAPVGIADFNGDGDIDIAYIDRPHLAKTLRIWTYRNGALEQIATQKGLTNHKIGWDFIAGGVRTCDGNTPEMINADANWKNIISTRFENGELTSQKMGTYSGPESLEKALDC